MQIEQILVQELCIPFKESFKHSSADRNETASVLVTARDDVGHIGYGESCPRHYVTGEDVASVVNFVNTHSELLPQEIFDVDSLRSWVDSHVAEIDASPAAWCAVELALLDLLARNSGQSVEKLLGIEPITGQFRYSAVIGECSLERFRKLAERYAALGIADFKIKVSGSVAEAIEKVRCLRQLRGLNPRIRLDGNNLWTDVHRAAAYLQELAIPLFAFEEPLYKDAHAKLVELAAESSIVVILDESFLRVEQFDCFSGHEDKIIVNLRVSKMGGIVRSLSIVEEARRRGVRLIIGAQVGETSLLTRAALTVAQQALDLLEAQEGAFGGYLLTRDLWEPTLTFGSGGLLDTQSIGPRGFGLALV